MSRLIDLTGRVVGKLTIVSRAPNNKYNQAQWHCLCSCGNKAIVAGSHLGLSRTRSCGCFRRTMRGRVADRFFENVAFSQHGCWEWLGYKSKGYGVFQIGNSRLGRPRFAAHRLSYMQTCGFLHYSVELDHLCRNPGCVNPDHLDPVTHRINMLRGMGPCGINARKTQCVHGHPYANGNLLIRKNGSRICRICLDASNERFKLKHPGYARLYDAKNRPGRNWLKERRERGEE